LNNLLVAPKLNDYNFTGQKTQANRQFIKKKTVIKVSTKLKVMVCSFTILFFLLGLTFTSLTAQVAAKGQDLNRLKKEIEALQVNNDRLQLERQRLVSLDNIETVAVSELGMVKPQFESLQIMNIDETSQANLLMALNNGSKEDKPNEESTDASKSLFTVIANGFSNWFITGK
jgi:cell division protein FtsL